MLDCGSNWRKLSDGLRVPQVSVNRRNDHSRFNRNQVDADERHTNPRINDDVLVQHVVEHVDDAGEVSFGSR